MTKLAVVSFIAALIALPGCATNPVTGASEIALVSEATTIARAEVAYRREVERLRSAGKLIESGPSYERVQDVTNRLVRQAAVMRPDAEVWGWEVHLIDEKETFNALCAPGGKMLIYSGLLSGLDLTDDELGQVMAHEVSHALLNHGREKLSVGILAAIVEVAAAASGTTTFDQDLRQSGADLATDLLMELPTSREDEAEADRIGIELAARAGYDPAAATAVWEKLIAIGRSTNVRADLWSTHPATPKRIEMLMLMRDSMTPLYLAARDVRGSSTDTARMASSTTTGGMSTKALSVESMCAFPSRVDRAECLGTLSVGMSLIEVERVLGSPDGNKSGGRWLRYTDRFLEFDTNGRLARISDKPTP